MKKKDNSRKTILIATGSSGGHLFPALAYAEEMKAASFSGVKFILSKPKSWTWPSELGAFEIFSVSPFSLPRGLNFSWIFFPFKLLVNSIKIFFILVKEKPDLVVGFGSYISFSAICIARLFGIPTIIHEQNAAFGKANAFLKNISSRVALSFPNLAKSVGAKGIVTGNPLRKTITQNAKNALYFPPKTSDKVNILILGGSQGSLSLNETVLEALKRLSVKEMVKFRVKHITGLSHYDQIQKKYDELPEELEREVVPFSEDMSSLYSWSHWVLARAGAGTIFELMAFGRPSLLIPYPYAESHQLANARCLEEAGGCEVVLERELTPEFLSSRLETLPKSTEFLKTLSDNARKNSILNGEEKLRDLSMSLLSKN